MPKLLLAIIITLFLTPVVHAGEQQYEELSDSTRASLQGLFSDRAPTRLFFDTPAEGERWLAEMSRRLAKILPRRSILQNEQARRDFLVSLHYEATRAGLPPQLVLSLVHVESAFRKYAISSAGARGYMQVMPFWTGLISGEQPHNLFNLRTNLRYGTIILRHYLDIEKGNLFRALGRYNGSLGRAHYPNAVQAKWKKHWVWP